MQSSLPLRLLACAVACTTLAAQEPVAATGPSYTMDVRLDPGARAVTGSQVIVWTNETSSPVSDLRFHMYLNAFRDRRSTFMREAGDSFRAQWRDGEFGSVEVESMQVQSMPAVGDPDSIAVTMSWIAPDDGNEDDRTVLQARLGSPVAPGQRVEIATTFRADLPKAYRRTGWVPGNGFFCMQWFPKLGVLEVDPGTGDSQWACAQFHANSEFYADFASYDVTIRAPQGFVVGATGGFPVEESTANGESVQRFRQENVHDFAFVADPDFVVQERSLGPFGPADDPGGVAARVAREFGETDSDRFTQPEVRVRVLLQPQHASVAQFDRHFEAVECGLRFYGLRFGAYPYPALTVIDPAGDIDGKSLGGGMEYPTLITCGSVPNPHPRQPKPEGVTVHEFGHQFWYGLVANNEVEEAWLDEGFTTYTEGRAQWLHYHESMRPARTTPYGSFLTFAADRTVTMQDRGVVGFGQLPIHLLPDPVAGELADLRFEGAIAPPRAWGLDLLAAMPPVGFAREAGYSDLWNDRRRLFAADNPDALETPTYEFLNRSSYVANAYHRPAMLLRTMERMVGKVRWWSFLRTYHERYRFSHATGADFVSALERELGTDVAQFFRLATIAGAVFDYGVDRVEQQPDASVVYLRRSGGIRADVPVRFVFADGSERNEMLAADDARPWWRYEFALRTEDGGAAPRLVEVWVDPPDPDAHEGPGGPVGTFPIDANLLDNAWRAKADLTPALYRAMRALQQAQFQLSFSAFTG